MKGYNGNPFHHSLIIRAESSMDSKNFRLVSEANSMWPRQTWIVPATAWTQGDAALRLLRDYYRSAITERPKAMEPAQLTARQDPRRMAMMQERAGAPLHPHLNFMSQKTTNDITFRCVVPPSGPFIAAGPNPGMLDDGWMSRTPVYSKALSSFSPLGNITREITRNYWFPATVTGDIPPVETRRSR